jgi:signal transduction histidine kinase
MNIKAFAVYWNMPNRKSLFPNLFLLLTMCLTVVFSQVKAASPADSARVQALMDSAFHYRSFDLERTRVLLQDALDLAQELKMDKTVAEGNNRLGLTCVLLGDYPAAAFHLNEARQFFERNGLKAGQSSVISNQALLYYHLEDYDRSLELNRVALQMREELDLPGGVATNANNIGNILVQLNRDLDEAKKAYERAYTIFSEIGNIPDAAAACSNIAIIHMNRSEFELAKEWSQRALSLINSTSTRVYHSSLYGTAASIRLKMNETDSALVFAQESIRYAQEHSQLREEFSAYGTLAEIAKGIGDFPRAFDALERSVALKDSIFNLERVAAIAKVEQAALLEQKDIELQTAAEKGAMQRRVNIYITFALVFALALIVSLFIAFRHNQKTNVLLVKQKAILQEQAEKLEALNRDKNRLFGVISHDLRGPIANLGGLLELINQRDLTAEEFKSLTGQLNTHFGHLSSSLDNLLLWSSNQMKGLVSEPRRFDLSEVCDEVADFLSGVAKSKGITLQNTVAPHLLVYADPEQIKVVIRNLVSNAIKFTPADGLVTIAAQSGFANKMQISVTDSGIGMSDEHQKKLLKGEESISTFGTRGERGTGLGLSLCRDFVRANHGNFWFESLPGKGSTFFFTLPVEVVHASAELEV